MTSALYLENYLDGLEHLPAELRRNFNLMRELDNRVQTLMKTIDKECNDFMKNTTTDNTPPLTEDGRRDKLKAIQDMFNKAKQLGDDKVRGLIIRRSELLTHQSLHSVSPSGSIGHSNVRTGGQTHQKIGRRSAEIRRRDPGQESHRTTRGECGKE